MKIEQDLNKSARKPIRPQTRAPNICYYFDLASFLLLVFLLMSLFGFATVEHQVRAQSAGVDNLGGNKLYFQL